MELLPVSLFVWVVILLHLWKDKETLRKFGILFESFSAFLLEEFQHFLNVPEQEQDEENQVETTPIPLKSPNSTSCSSLFIQKVKKTMITQSTQVEDVDFQDIGLKLSTPRHTTPSISYMMGLPSTLRGENQLRIARLKYLEIDKMFQVHRTDQTTQTEKDMIDVETHIDDDLIPPTMDYPPEYAIERPVTPLKMDQMMQTIQIEKIRVHSKTNHVKYQIENLLIPSLISTAIQLILNQDYSDLNQVTPRTTNEKIKKENLSCLLLTDLPFQLMEESNITSLNLSSNLLTSIPTWFCESCKNISTLNLSNNLIRDLPDNFTQMKSLRELDLSYNRFEYIPFSILKLVHLTTLSFNNNILVMLPNEIGKLKNSLSEWDLSNNLLMDFPDEYKKLKIKYKVNNNPFVYFPLFDIIPKLSTWDKKVKKEDQDVRLRDLALSKKSIQLLEFLESERKYVQHLKLAMDMYINPIKAKSTEELNGCLSIIFENIYEFSKRFLACIETELRGLERENMDVAQVNLTQIMFEHLEEMKSLYLLYPSEYKRLMDVLRTFKDSTDITFFATRKKMNIILGIDLDQFYLLPMSRVVKYENLLLGIKKETPSYHQDSHYLYKAIDGFVKYSESFRFEVAKINNRYRMLELSKRWKMETLLSSDRWLIREEKLKTLPSKEISQMKSDLSSLHSFSEKFKQIKGVTSLSSYFSTPLGEMRLTEGYVNLFLFNDIFIVEETSMWKLLKPWVIPLSEEGTEVESSVNNECEFIVHFPPKKMIVFRTDDKIKRNEWFKEFWANISNIHKDNPGDPKSIKTDFIPDQLI